MFLIGDDCTYSDSDAEPATGSDDDDDDGDGDTEGEETWIAVEDSKCK